MNMYPRGLIKKKYCHIILHSRFVFVAMYIPIVQTNTHIQIQNICMYREQIYYTNTHTYTYNDISTETGTQ